jgi:flagellar assembly protein FliH
MSSEATVVRTRVLRGAAAAAIRGSAVLDADLMLARPATSLANPLASAADAAAVSDQAREEAARVGYEDGFQAGLKAGAAEVQARAAAAAGAVDAALIALESAAAQLATREAAGVADVEQRITALALQIAQAVVGREVATSPTAGRDAILRALQLAPEGTAALVRINPVDLDTVGELARITNRAISLIPDPAVEQGGCVLEAGPCRIDAQVGPALARVREVLGA